VNALVIDVKGDGDDPLPQRVRWREVGGQSIITVRHRRPSHVLQKKHNPLPASCLQGIFWPRPGRIWGGEPVRELARPEHCLVDPSGEEVGTIHPRSREAAKWLRRDQFDTCAFRIRAQPVFPSRTRDGGEASRVR